MIIIGYHSCDYVALCGKTDTILGGADNQPRVFFDWHQEELRKTSCCSGGKQAAM